MNLWKFYRMEFSVRNLGISILSLFSVLAVKGTLDILPAAIFIFQLLLVQMNSFSMNDYFDYRVWDEDNYIHRLVENENWSHRKVLLFTVLPLIVLAATVPFSNVFFWILPAYTLLFYLYQGPGIRLKNNFVWSIILNSVCLGTILYIYPYLALAGIPSPVFWVFAATFTFYMAFHELVHQIAHMEKDRIHSMPERTSISTTVKLAEVFMAVPLLSALILFLKSPSEYVYLLGVVIFSAVRIYRVSETPETVESFQDIRNRWDKFYSFQEAIFIISAVILIFL